MNEQFQPLSIQQKELFARYFSTYPQVHCEYNFNTLICWNIPYQYKWALIEDHLVIWLSGIDVLLMPVGKALSTGLFHHISSSFQQEGFSGIFILVDQKPAADNPDLRDFFSIKRDRNLADYIHNSRDLAELKGRQYQKKRNLINQFEKQYSEYQVEEMDDNHLEICRKLSEKWCREMDCDQKDFEDEMSALSTAFRYYHELSLKGINICHEDRLVAFSLFSRQNSDMFTMHFEKFDPQVKGAGQIINRESAKYIVEHFNVPYINREQDLGLEGLRQAKLSYNPAYIYETVQLIPKEQLK